MSFKVGIFENIPFNEYLSIDAVSKSMFKHIMRSGKALKHYRETDYKSKQMDFGNLVDTLLFEPDKYTERFIVPPDKYMKVATYKTKEDKIEYKPWSWNANYCIEWKKEHENYNIISNEVLAIAKIIVNEIKNHPQAQKWLNDGIYQVSMFWVDPDTCLYCKARPDILTSYCIPDLKVTYDCHPKAFSKTLNNLFYHAGAAFYHDGYYLSRGLDVPETIETPMIFIVAEDKAPFDVICYSLDQDSFDVGRAIYKDALQRYKEFKESNEYPGYSNVCEEISIPHWAINKYQMEGVIE